MHYSGSVFFCVHYINIFYFFACFLLICVLCSDAICKKLMRQKEKSEKKPDDKTCVVSWTHVTYYYCCWFSVFYLFMFPQTTLWTITVDPQFLNCPTFIIFQLGCYIIFVPMLLFIILFTRLYSFISNFWLNW